jgi:hypothetical protein
MSRQEKGSRIRMLPARIQLQQRDALTGSYPTNVRFSTDGRTGNYKVNFDDTYVVDFVSTTQSSFYSAPQNLGLDYSPLALYTFDGNINDQSGNSYNLSVHSGSLQYTDGPFYGSQAILFDGYNALTSSVISALQITGAVTLQAFIKSNTTTVSSVGKAVASLAGIGESLNTNILYSMFVDGDNKAGSFGYDIEKGLGVDVSEFSIASLLQPGKWYHIAIARNGSSNSKLYLNGTLITSFTNSTFPAKDVSGNLQRLIVGTHPSSLGDYQAFAYKGAVSNLKIVNRELTIDEIKSEYERVFPEGILAGVGFPISSKWIQNRIELDLPTTGGISAPGNVATQVIEDLPFFHFTPGQELTPFRDNDQPAVDGKSQNNPFFATGSAVLEVGEGFSSPLWSKNKIEIDISAVNSTSLLTFCQNTGVTKNLAYYNFNTKLWEPLAGAHGAREFSDFGAAKMAFTPSLMTYANGLEPANKARATTTFGFPFHPIYAATSSQLLSMKTYIDQPFLLEKIVVKFTASFQSGIGDVFDQTQQFDWNGDPIYFSSSYAVNNIFVINQRHYNLKQKDIFAGFFDETLYYHINTTIPAGNVNTIRDLIGYGSIASFNNAYGWAYTASVNPNALYDGRWQRDLNIIDSINTDATKSFWSGCYELSFSVKVPNYFGDNLETFVPSSIYPKGLAWQIFDGGISVDGVGHIQNGGSLGLGIINSSGRNLLSPIASINPQTTITPAYGGVKLPIVANKEYNTTNPYLLLPTDNILIGWSAATMDDYSFIGNSTITYQTASILTIASGPAKITLYGSYIRQNREYNDGLNQLLSSDSIHEVIE